MAKVVGEVADAVAVGAAGEHGLPALEDAGADRRHLGADVPGLREDLCRIVDVHRRRSFDRGKHPTWEV